MKVEGEEMTIELLPEAKAGLVCLDGEERGAT